LECRREGNDSCAAKARPLFSNAKLYAGLTPEPYFCPRLRFFASIWIWLTAILLMVVWLPLLALIKLFDRDPVRYRTGRWFRRLGATMTHLNPLWQIRIDGERIENPRLPYVVVCNHQSLADIPIISRLPWEMKWVAKAELFSKPLVGSMLKLAGDIAVERDSKRSRAKVIIDAMTYLNQRCSVMFFPEGTRSLDGSVGEFNVGAFHLAIRAGVPILPLVINGTSEALPKNNWLFKNPGPIRLRVLPPVPTDGLDKSDVQDLSDRVRNQIILQIEQWRSEAK
jgi:1-acyl-sn-glycerol-3-phosphate acyltransferase